MVCTLQTPSRTLIHPNQIQYPQLNTMLFLLIVLINFPLLTGQEAPKEDLAQKFKQFATTSGSLSYKYLTPPPKGIPARPGSMFDDGSMLVSLSSNGGGSISCEQTYAIITTVEKVKEETGDNDTITLYKISGKRLGRDYLCCKNEDSEIEVPITVLRHRGILDEILPNYVIGMVIVLNIVFGTEVSLKHLKFIILRPKPLIAAAVGQFILLPLLGLGLVRLFNYEPDIGLGLLMVACAPGGGNSNTVTYLIDGEVPLSIAMTFFSTFLSLGTMPLNLWLYGRFITDDPKYSQDDIPYLKLITTLLLIIVPVAVGMAVAARFSEMTKRVMKYAKPVVFLVVLAFIIMAIWRSVYAFELVSYDSVLGAVALPVGGFILGTIGAVVMRVRLSQVKTIALEVGMQNAGIVVGMGFLAFKPPEADLNVIMPIYVSMLTSVVAIPFYLLHLAVYKSSKRYRAICKQNKEDLRKEVKAYHGSESSDYFDRRVSDDDKIGFEGKDMPTIQVIEEKF